MFLHHTMTDREILRTTEGCESRHLRLVADRLRERSDALREVIRLARFALASYHIDEVHAALDDIIEAASADT
jgi:hypothetical protein